MTCHDWLSTQVDKALIMNPDNALTDEGLKQAARGREDLAGTTLRQAQLIVTSPLTRAMQTTGLLMGSLKANNEKTHTWRIIPGLASGGYPWLVSPLSMATFPFQIGLHDGL